MINYFLFHDTFFEKKIINFFFQYKNENIEIDIKGSLKMSSKRTNYDITFGIQNQVQRGAQNQKKVNEISEKDITFEGTFKFYDYNLNSNIGCLKEFFLTSFGEKYHFCKCVLFVFYQVTVGFMSTNFRLLSESDDTKLKDKPYDKLFLIKRNVECNCIFKMYKDYMKMPKFNVIAELRASHLEINKLKKEIEVLKKSDELKHHNKSKVEDFYDIVIDIKSIKSINKEGWPVKFNKEGLEKYNTHKNEKEEKSIILGVLGNNNKGKSFLLSRISKIDLLIGKSIETKGLSVKYPKLEGYNKRQIILLDSAGLETPVLKKDKNDVEKNKLENDNEIIIDNKKDEEKDQNNNEEKLKLKEEINKKENDILNEKEIEQNKEFKENARDKIMTELFLQKFIIMVSDILLIVVGKLTYSEQLLINKIKVESKKANKGRIFIIHNLQEFSLVSEVQDYIKNTLLKCSTFNLKKRTRISIDEDEVNEKERKSLQEKEEKYKINGIEENKDIQIKNKDEINIEIKDDKEEKNKKFKKINEENVEEDSKLMDIHFTEIIKYENNQILEVYHLILANEITEAGKAYNPYAIKFIVEQFNSIPNPKKFDIFDQVKDNFKELSEKILNDNIKDASFNENEKIIEDKIIKLKYEKELTLKKCFTDELGFSFFKTGDFEPKYNYFKPDENTLEIRLEVPGRTPLTTFHNIVGDDTIVTIKGTKMKDTNPKEPNYNIVNIREFSDFELNIPLKAEQYKINGTKPKEGYPKYNSGVCLIQYELAKKAEETNANPEDAEEL